MHFIVAGLSSIGRSLAELLQREGKDVVAIDSSEARCTEMAESSDVMVMEGDITQRSVLEEAGVKGANALVALTNDDSDNLMACMLAKEMGAKKVISILNDAVHAEAFKEAGIDVQVKPDAIVAKHVYHMILQPYVKGFLALDKAELFEIEVEGGMKCVGKKIAEMEIPKGAKTLWLERGGKYVNEDAEIEPEDRLTLIVARECSKRGADFMNKWFTKR